MCDVEISSKEANMMIEAAATTPGNKRIYTHAHTHTHMYPYISMMIRKHTLFVNPCHTERNILQACMFLCTQKDRCQCLIV